MDLYVLDDIQLEDTRFKITNIWSAYIGVSIRTLSTFS